VTDARSLIHAAGDALLRERRQLTSERLAALAALPDESIPALASLAHEVRLAWCGPEVEVEGILEAIRWIALFRLALPSVILRYAGGREVTLRELQALGLTSGINALIVGNYLTTLGRSPAEDLQMLADLRMPIGVLSKAI
jgi:biotin synthase-like enzyme